MTEYRTVALQSDGDRIHRWLNNVVADAIAEVAEAVRLVREWCDTTEANIRARIAVGPASDADFAYWAGTLSAIDQVRKRLPTGEVSTVGTRVTRSDEREM